ncbi:MAG: hypothetical protein AABZ33_11385 [Chloroflexota bacterium]
MSRSTRFRTILVAGLALALILPAAASATHSWGNYHWGRTANPFTLKLGDNVSSAWDSYLATTSVDWSVSTVLDTTIVAGGTTARKCRATTGRVEVCNASYGNNGWLGLASISVSGSHITKAYVKLNDTYFKTAAYNTPAWRNLVMCQEVGHTFGLGHTDETFGNANGGTCMDYTSDPDGPLSNEHPNDHDYEQLAMIYAHLDSTTTVGAAAPSGPGGGNGAAEAASSGWGRLVATTNGGRGGVYLLDLGNGDQVVTHVFWAR